MNATLETPCKMKPSLNLLALAKDKLANLKPGQQIRLGGGEYHSSYWILRDKDGLGYIGYYIVENAQDSSEKETLGAFFKRSEYQQINSRTNAHTMNLQRLLK